LEHGAANRETKNRADALLVGLAAPAPLLEAARARARGVTSEALVDRVLEEFSQAALPHAQRDIV
jgi:hypothetical protein